MIENKYTKALEQIWGSESYRVTLLLSTIGNLYAECDFSHDRRRLNDSNYIDVLNDMFMIYCLENKSWMGVS
jgi:hypothetical protein